MNNEKDLVHLTNYTEWEFLKNFVKSLPYQVTMFEFEYIEDDAIYKLNFWNMKRNKAVPSPLGYILSLDIHIALGLFQNLKDGETYSLDGINKQIANEHIDYGEVKDE